MAENFYSTLNIDFSRLVKQAKGVIIDGERLKKALTFEGTGVFTPTGKTVSYIYNINDKIFVYCTDKKLYLYNGTQFNLASSEEFNERPKIVSVIYDGQEKFLALTDQKKVICGLEYIELDFPDGEHYAFHNGRLFIAKNDTLHFGSDCRFNEFSVGINLAGSITLKKEDGNICALVEILDNLFVVCEHKIYLFSAFGEQMDYTLKVVKTPCLNIKKDTITWCAHTLYFINDTKVTSFDGSTFTQFDTVLDLDNYTVCGEVGLYGYSFVAPIEEKDSFVRRAFYYNTKTGEQFISEQISPSFCRGYDVNLSTGEITALCGSGEGEFYFSSKRTDLGLLLNKTMVGFSVYANGNATVKITGDELTRTFYIKKGLNVKRFNFPSTFFSFEIYGQTDALIIDNLKIKYAKRGKDL